MIAPIAFNVVRLLDLVLAQTELDAAGSRLDPEKLIEVRVRLATDVFTRRQTHHRQLNVLAGIQDSTERIVRQRRALDVANPSEHPTSTRFAALLTRATPTASGSPIHPLEHPSRLRSRLRSRTGPRQPTWPATPTTPGMKG
jgi:hypothetical protein